MVDNFYEKNTLGKGNVSDLASLAVIFYNYIGVASMPEHLERSPPPEIGKIVVEIWCYLPEVYTFGAESEIQ